MATLKLTLVSKIQICCYSIQRVLAVVPKQQRIMLKKLNKHLNGHKHHYEAQKVVK